MTNVTETFEQMNKKRRDNILKSFGVESENPFEIAAADIEKSDIMDVISYSESFKFNKTGKEIIDKVKNFVLPKKNAELEAKKVEADRLLADCGDAPTAPVCDWWLNGFDIDCGYKRYEWHETCKESRAEVYDSLSFEHQAEQPKVNCPKTEDEAKARCEYNKMVEIICRIIVDVKACQILINNLKENESIKMTARQLCVFGFE